MKIDRCFEKLFGLADAVNSDTIYFNTVHTACFPFSTLSAHRQTISPSLRVMRLKFFPHSPQTKRPLSTFSELYRAVFLVWSEVILLRFCFSSWAFTNCSFGMMRRYFSLESMYQLPAQSTCLYRLVKGCAFRQDSLLFFSGWIHSSIIRRLTE